MKKQIIITDTDAGTNSLNDLQINNRALKSYKLPVYIDSVYVNRPENVNKLLIKIKSVTISTEAITGIKFINILTYRNSVNIQNGNKTEKHGNSETPIMIR